MEVIRWPQFLCCSLALWSTFRTHLYVDALAGRKSARRASPKSKGGGGGFGSKQSNELKPRYIPDESPQTSALLQFLDSEEAEGIGSTEIGISTAGLRGLYAKESFQPGDFICAIPFPAAIVIDNGELESDAERGLILYKNFLQHRESASRWDTYIDTLPDKATNFDPTPDFYSQEEIDALEVPGLVKESTERKHQIAVLAAKEGQDVGALQFATWLVKSRAFTTLKVSRRSSNESKVKAKSVLIPYLDMINHSSDHANAKIEVVESPGSPEESYYALQCTRSIASGKEITLSYGTGEETSADIFCNYGFLPDSNKKIDAALTDKSFEWQTSLLTDEELLKKAVGNMKSVLAFRIRAKRASASIKQVASDQESRSQRSSSRESQ